MTTFCIFFLVFTIHFTSSAHFILDLFFQHQVNSIYYDAPHFVSPFCCYFMTQVEVSQRTSALRSRMPQYRPVTWTNSETTVVM
jgi:hypothetical protein